jgi:hypothetical protein
MLIKYCRHTKLVTEIENAHAKFKKSAVADEFIFFQNEIGSVLTDHNDYTFNTKLKLNNSGATLVTESSGYYQLYYYNQPDTLHISDSVFTLLPIVSSPTLNKQNCLEYINMSTVLGNETVFNEIKKFCPHAIYDLDTLTYHKLQSFQSTNESGLQALEKRLKTYFDALKKLDQPIYVDLSGGYDTRTVLSCLIHFGVPYELVTNNRSVEVSSDVIIAKKIAERLNKTLIVVDIEPAEIDYRNIDPLIQTDMVRGIDIAFRLKQEIENKAQLEGVKIGGWGAEMIRNQYATNKSFDQIVSGFAYKKLIFKSVQEEVDYLRNISSKLKEEMAYWNINSQSPQFSKFIHYHIKARHWAGTMLTMRNRHTATLFPFYHPDISFVCNSFENNNQIQIELIEKFAPILNGIPYSSADKPLDLTSKLVYTYKKWSRKIYRKLGLKNRLRSKMDYSFKAELFYDDEILNKLLNLSMKHLEQTNQTQFIPRYCTILSIFKNYIIKHEEN